MKIKQIIAPSMLEALARIKTELGDEAVIISNTTDEMGQIVVTAAIEESFEINFDEQDELEVTPTPIVYNDYYLRECLDYHGVIPVISDKILATARQIALNQKIGDERQVLEKTLADIYCFGDILDTTEPVKMFMGTPGSGKSTAIAKTAAQARFQKISCCIISTDNVRAGANKQLEAFAQILELDFAFCPEERNLYETIRQARQKFALILVDTPGINPFIEKEVDRVGRLAELVKNEAILTMDAGRNPFEAIEIAEIFSSIGARFLLPTRLDLTRRLGAVLSVAACGGFCLCAASVSSSIANGLAKIDNRALAKLVLSEA